MNRPWISVVVYFAGVYNIVWGTIVILFPNELFALANMPPANYPELFQCIGMMIAVIGVGYLCAGHNPVRHWPLIVAGLLGRILGPIGYVMGVLKGTFTLSTGITILTNDIIWLIPFSMILWVVYKERKFSNEK